MWMCRNNWTILPDLLYNTVLLFLAGRQVLAQELGIGDAFVVEMDVVNVNDVANMYVSHAVRGIASIGWLSMV